MTQPHFRAARQRPRNTGVGLITAIFLLVFLGGLGVALVGVFNAQQAASSADVLGARAYQAARADIEWGLFQKLRNNSCVAESSFALPATGALKGFTVTVACTLTAGPVPASGPANALDRWLLQSVACNLQPAGGRCPAPVNNPDYVQRTMEVRI